MVMNINLLLPLAFLLIIAINYGPAHARTLPADINPRSEKFEMIISIYGKPALSPPPSPKPTPWIRHDYSRQGSHNPCDGVGQKNNCKLLRLDYVFKSPPPPLPPKPAAPGTLMTSNDNDAYLVENSRSTSRQSTKMDLSSCENKSNAKTESKAAFSADIKSKFLRSLHACWKKTMWWSNYVELSFN
ncbi:hypothetical protein PanWU01x14_025260 [Parasponia andersonii]|uniref:Hydroxyproline-rich glycoprotein family protein n=1 Tax=Parasponia andersonii TaxID=3476 RepID=A0A2P5DWV9_PARAD|nr:hypothetical protein PanWU01x14_025260 [Parasponia andersonii]